MKVSEIFYSIQGEGKLTGVPSVFIRLTGCNLRCRWCDTPYTSWQPEGEQRSIDSMLTECATFPTRHVVVTGGEPLLTAEIVPLCAAFAEAGYHITLETAGTVYRPALCDLASISPKLSNSTPPGRFALRHESLRLRPDVIQRLMDRNDYQLKFVIDEPSDLDEVDELLRQLPTVDRNKVMLMPQGVEREELAERGGWLAGVCLKRGFRYCPRLHIDLFGNRRGT